jgi:predicted metalloendopeptidase
VHLNGEAECGENIADMGGVKFAFRGMQVLTLPITS